MSKLGQEPEELDIELEAKFLKEIGKWSVVLKYWLPPDADQWQDLIMTSGHYHKNRDKAIESAKKELVKRVAFRREQDKPLEYDKIRITA